MSERRKRKEGRKKQEKKKNLKKESKFFFDAPDSLSASQKLLHASAAGPHMSLRGRWDRASPRASLERTSMGCEGEGSVAGRGGEERSSKGSSVEGAPVPARSSSAAAAATLSFPRAAGVLGCATSAVAAGERRSAVLFFAAGVLA